MQIEGKGLARGGRVRSNTISEIIAFKSILNNRTVFALKDKSRPFSTLTICFKHKMRYKGTEIVSDANIKIRAHPIQDRGNQKIYSLVSSGKIFFFNLLKA